jgi:hypothetical protein
MAGIINIGRRPDQKQMVLQINSGLEIKIGERLFDQGGKPLTRTKLRLIEKNNQ